MVVRAQMMEKKYLRVSHMVQNLLVHIHSTHNSKSLCTTLGEHKPDTLEATTLMPLHSQRKCNTAISSLQILKLDLSFHYVEITMLHCAATVCETQRQQVHRLN